MSKNKHITQTASRTELRSAYRLITPVRPEIRGEILMIGFGGAKTFPDSLLITHHCFKLDKGDWRRQIKPSTD